MIDHVTIHVEPGTLKRADLADFFRIIGMAEVDADDPYEHGWDVRWFAPWDKAGATTKPYIHLVETDEGEHDIYALGHFCVVMDPDIIRTRAPERITRDSGSGRIWLGFANIRVEVRP